MTSNEEKIAFKYEQDGQEAREIAKHGKKIASCCRAGVTSILVVLYYSNTTPNNTLYTSSIVPYFPFKGIPRFYDIGGFLAEPEVFQQIVDIFVDRYREIGIDSIAGYVTECNMK